MLWDLERSTDEYRELQLPGKEVCNPQPLRGQPVRWWKRKPELQLQTCWRVCVDKLHSYKLQSSMVTSRPTSTSSGNTMCLCCWQKRGKGTIPFFKRPAFRRNHVDPHSGIKGRVQQPQRETLNSILHQPSQRMLCSAPGHRLTSNRSLATELEKQIPVPTPGSHLNYPSSLSISLGAKKNTGGKHGSLRNFRQSLNQTQQQWPIM